MEYLALVVALLSGAVALTIAVAIAQWCHETESYLLWLADELKATQEARPVVTVDTPALYRGEDPGDEQWN